jgi:uncharacterized membrane protein YphA (DoxX/SURF4 family)
VVVLPLVASVVLAVLFATSAWHKLDQHRVFTAIVADYQILPAALVVPCAFALALAELVVAGLWATQMALPFASIASVALFALYCFAVGINLVRGRTHISCGCGIGSEQPISIAIIVRNALLAALALCTLVVGSAGSPGWLDYAVAIMASAAIGVALAASSALMTNAMHISSWADRD